MARKSASAAAVADVPDIDDDGDAADIWEPDYSSSLPLADSQSVLRTIQEATPDCLLPSGYVAMPCVQATTRDTNAGDMRATFTFVTRPKKNEPNRAGRMIQIVPGQFGNGIQIEAYKQNPIVLFNHGMDGFAFPVGLSEDKNGNCTVKMTKQRAYADVYFSQSSPIAEDIFRMVQAGILRAASIGFNPLKVVPMRWDDNSQLPPGVEITQRFGYDVTESELMEWSVVAAGADAGALKQCLDTGKIAGKSYRPVLTPWLRQHAEPRGAWSPGIGAGTGAGSGTGGVQHVATMTDPSVNGLRQLFAEFATTITTAIQQAVTPPANPNPLPLVETPAAASAIAVVQNLATPAPVTTIPQVNSNGNPPATPTASGPAATQQEFQTMLQQQLSAMVSRIASDVIQPVVTSQNGINQRLDSLMGKLPV